MTTQHNRSIPHAQCIWIGSAIAVSEILVAAMPENCPEQARQTLRQALLGLSTGEVEKIQLGQLAIIALDSSEFAIICPAAKGVAN